MDSMSCIGRRTALFSGLSATLRPANWTNSARKSAPRCNPRLRPADWCRRPLAGKAKSRSDLKGATRRDVPTTRLARQIFVPPMDQRTDTEHRLDAAPGGDNKPAIGEARKTQPWLDRMRRRRRQVLIITALIVAAIVATVTYWLNT